MLCPSYPDALTSHVAGERFPLTLQFEQAGEVGVSVEVRAPGATPPAAH